MAGEQMVYRYVAYSESGKVVKGRLSAATEEAANELLAYAGYRTVSLKLHVPFLSLDGLSAGLFRLKPTDVVLFFRQLAMLIESGTNIAASLELLRDQTDSRALKKILGEAMTDVRGGSQLSSSLGKHPEVFPPIYCQMVRIGEQSGDIETVLRQVADYMEKQANTAKETKNALMYPIIAFVMTIVVIGVLVGFVLPSFGKLYGSLGADLPATAKMLIAVSDKARSHGLYFLLAASAIIGSALVYSKTPGGRYKRDRLLLRLPVIGRVSHLGELARCCRSMSLLFHAGLPLTEAVPLAMQGCTNTVMARALLGVQQDMLEGGGLSGPMAKNRLFLPMMVQMARVGEETGNLDVTLLAVARSYETEAEDKMHVLIGLIQPVMTVFLGVVIGLIAVTLFQTIYGMQGANF
ncbi:MAG: type II secretion system F family protein [Chloroflexota bacterium]